jgi:hypothetical protein
MTTRNDYKRKGVNSKIVKAMRDYFKIPQDKVVFVDTTKEGKKFEEAKTFNEGGTINSQKNTNIMETYKFNEMPLINTISDNDLITYNLLQHCSDRTVAADTRSVRYFDAARSSLI